MDLIQLSKIAIEAARAAGKIIQQSVQQDVLVEQKESGSSYASQVVTEVDRACESVILNHLLPSCDKYGLAILSEETEDDGSRFQKKYFWCIDPMDGTLAFINKHPGFSVSIALVAIDGTPTIGVVYDPSTDTLYHAIKSHGVYKNNKPWQVSNTNEYLSYLTDRQLKDTPQANKIEGKLNEYAEKLSVKEVKEISGAGAVLNAILVLENGPAFMMKFPKKEMGGGSIWDYAATACIYNELGLPATTFDGRKLDLNRREDTFMNQDGVFYGNLK